MIAYIVARSRGPVDGNWIPPKDDRMPAPAAAAQLSAAIALIPFNRSSTQSPGAWRRKPERRPLVLQGLREVGKTAAVLDSDRPSAAACPPIWRSARAARSSIKTSLWAA